MSERSGSNPNLSRHSCPNSFCLALGVAPSLYTTALVSLIFCILNLFFLVPFANAVELQDHHHILGVGLSEEFVLPGAIHISNNKIIKVRELSGGRLAIIGKAPGEVTLRNAKQEISIHVVSSEIFELAKKMKVALGSRKGLTLQVEGSQVILAGELLRLSDWIYLSELAQNKPSPYLFHAQIPDVLRPKIRAHFETLLKEASHSSPPWTLTPYPKVDIPAGSSDQKKVYEKIFAPYGFEIVNSGMSFLMKPMIEVEVAFTELKKSDFQRLGIQWPPSTEIQPFQNPSNAASSLKLFLDAVEAQGEGRILARPKLVARSGEEAELLAGGELPFRVVSGKTRDIVWKKYGAQLYIKPESNTQNEVHLQVRVEVSNIDPGQMVDGLPAILSRRIKSDINLRSGQSLILSGLVHQSESRSAEGLPALLKLPILGRLFSSHDFLSLNSELVVFVTPKILQPVVTSRDPSPEVTAPF